VCAAMREKFPTIMGMTNGGTQPGNIVMLLEHTSRCTSLTQPISRSFCWQFNELCILKLFLFSFHENFITFPSKPQNNNLKLSNLQRKLILAVKYFDANDECLSRCFQKEYFFSLTIVYFVYWDLSFDVLSSERPVILL